MGRLTDQIKTRRGVKDVEVGHPDFDERFTVRTDDPAKLRNAFDSSILEQVMRPPDLAEIRIDSEPIDGPVPRPANLLIWKRLMTHDVDELVDFHELISPTWWMIASRWFTSRCCCLSVIGSPLSESENPDVTNVRQF